jgi:hypothetical protein
MVQNYAVQCALLFLWNPRCHFAFRNSAIFENFGSKQICHYASNVSKKIMHDVMVMLIM